MNKLLITFLLVTLMSTPVFTQEQTAGKTRLMAIMQTTENFSKALDGIKTELGSNYIIDVVDVKKNAKPDALLEQCRKDSVRGFILMDFEALAIAREFEKDPSVKNMPKFVLMTLQVEKACKGLTNAVGVRFEVPAYTLVTNLRIISQNDISRIGVFYRKAFSPMIDEARKQLAREKVELVDACVDEDGKALNAEKALSVMRIKADELLKSKKIDAFWMMADNLIVSPTTVTEVWIGKIKKANKPIMVPLENLASLQLNMGLFAANPDYLELGAQTAGLIVSVFEDETPIDEIGFEPLTSVKTVLNLDVAKQINWPIRTDKIQRVNKVFKSGK